MEDNNLPPTQPVSPAATDTLDGTSQSVASYSLPAKSYPVENLEVHTEGTGSARVGTVASGLRSVPFSRRRAMVVSLVITLLVLLATAAVSILFVRDRRTDPSSSQLSVPSQDISLDQDVQTALPELQGTKDALLVNGDLIARGTLKVVSGAFVSSLGSQTLSVNRTITLPDASGIVCLDVNNCNFATLAQLNQAQAQTQILAGGGGVTNLNGLSGVISVQGSLNRVTVATGNGIITLSTPQDLDANANVQFGSLTLGTGLTVASGGTGSSTLTANGLLLGNGTSPIGAVVAAGAGQCLVSTAGAPAFQACPGGGGGGVTSLNSLTGALTLQGTANQINVVSGGSTITLSTPQNIATTSSPTFAGLTSPTLQSTGALQLISTSSSDLTLTSARDIFLSAGPGRLISLTNFLRSTASIDIDGLAVIGPGNTLAGSVTSSGNTLVVTDTFAGSDDCTFGCAAISAYAEKGSASAIFMDAFRGQIKVGDGQSLNTGTGLFVEGSVVGAGATLTSNYGVYVASQTVGTNDYGLYVQHADTYGLWIDSGATRLDGTLEVQALGSADSATYLCHNSSNQLATCSGAAAGAAFVQGGNSFGAVGTLGTNDANSLQLETNNVTRLTLDTSGNATLTGNLTVQGVGISNFSGSADIAGTLAAGDSATIGGLPVALTANETFTGSDSCGLGCYGTSLVGTANGVTAGGVGALVANVVTAAAPFTLPQAAAISIFNPTVGSGSSITNNAGLSIANQTAGTAIDYGIYVQGADTYALFVDAGATRLDGTLEVQTLGATDTATYLCRNSSNQLAACSTGSGAAFVQDGNDFGGTGTLGLISNDTLNVITNSVTRLSVTGAGATTITAGTTGNPVALTVNNSTSTGNILVLQDNGGDVLTVADGGNVTSTADLAVNGGDITSTATNLNINSSAGSGNVVLQTNGVSRLTVSTSAVTSTLPFLGPNGSTSAPTYSFSGDTNTGMYWADPTDGDQIGFSVGGSNVVTIGADPGASPFATGNLRIASNDISVTEQFEILSEGAEDLDVGIGRGAAIFINEANTGGEFRVFSDGTEIFTLSEGGELRTDLTMEGGTVAFLQGFLRLGVEQLSRTDGQEITPGSSFIELTCATGGGCTLTMDEDNPVRGQTVRIINVGTNTVTINDAAGSTELAGNWATAGQWDSLEMIYVEGDGTGGRWVELTRSDN
jgi:hypothetical protein